MRKAINKTVAFLLSWTLVANCSFLPAAYGGIAVAQAAETETVPSSDSTETGESKDAKTTVSESVSVQYRLNDEEDWRSATSFKDAIASEGLDVCDKNIAAAQIRIVGLDAVADLQVRNVGSEWPKSMEDADGQSEADTSLRMASETTTDADDADNATYVEGPFEELRARIDGEDAASYALWYRVHTESDGWLGWARDGESAGTQGAERAIDGLQLLVVAKDEEAPDANPQAFIVEGTEGAVEADIDADAIKEDEASDDKSGDTDAVEVEIDDAIVEDTKDSDKALEAQTDEKKVAEAKNAKADNKDAEQTDLEMQASVPSITYSAHVQRIGWQDAVANGETAGTSGQSLRVEALRVMLPKDVNGGVTYSVHVQNIGWQDWVKDGEDAGTSGQSLRLEALKIKLTGEAANKYDVYYRSHIQRFGWLAWAKNGESSGSGHLSLRMEAVQIRLVAKGAAAPSSSDSHDSTYVDSPELSYRGHVQRIGWQDWVSDGNPAGTSGQSLRVEALETRVDGKGISGEVQLNAHVQRIGWESDWSTLCGTSGQSLRVEAIKARLTGELGEQFDIYYRVHAQRIGWMGWAKNGEQAGTAAMSLRLEAIEMRLVPKWKAGPSSGEECFIDGAFVDKMGYQNPAGFYQVSSKNVQITSAATYPWNYVTPSRIGVWATREECVNAFISRAREYLGTPYVWDYSCAPGVGVDCIGLVYQCAYACGMDLGGGTGYDDFNPWAHWITGSGGWHSHDANNFWDYGKVMHVSLSARQPGDLISWSGHVAIYLGDDTIIEAYPGSVTYASLWAHGTPRGCMRLFH